MQLEYRILWFEDQPRNVEPFANTIRDGLTDLGFVPQIDIRPVIAGGPEPLKNLPLARDVDLLLVDWHLGGGYDGASLSKKLRQLFRYTDVVFYSSDVRGELRKLIFEQDIDGVHCCTRTHLSEQTLGIIKTQMRKVLDLNHMRGIVMATTSDLDQRAAIPPRHGCIGVRALRAGAAAANVTGRGA
jgi:CheY-like chemotaxis protein